MLRKNQSGQFLYFQGVDSSTGGIKSGVTWTIRRCIDGTFAAGGGTVTEDSTNGWYKYALSQADTNGNNLGFNFTGTGAVPQTINVITTAADPTNAQTFGITALPAANAGAAGGLWILGANAAATTTLTGLAASGATPATPAVLFTGGAASTTGGGTSAPGVAYQGGAGAASTNGAAAGLTSTAGGTVTVSGNDGAIFTATGNSHGMTLTHAGIGKDLNAQTTNSLAVNATAVGGSTAGATNMGAAWAGLETGTAQSGGTNTLTLRSGASSSDNYYKDQVVVILSGTGAGQTNRITAYTGSSRLATVETNWVTVPDATSVYVVLGRVG